MLLYGVPRTEAAMRSLVRTSPVAQREEPQIGTSGLDSASAANHKPMLVQMLGQLAGRPWESQCSQQFKGGLLVELRGIAPPNNVKRLAWKPASECPIGFQGVPARL